MHVDTKVVMARGQRRQLASLRPATVCTRTIRARLQTSMLMDTRTPPAGGHAADVDVVVHVHVIFAAEKVNCRSPRSLKRAFIVLRCL
jgi:hypothetical protein